MRYGIRQAETTAWLCDLPGYECAQWFHKQDRATFSTKAEALAFLAREPRSTRDNAVLVRLLTHAEAKLKAQAEVLREMADRLGFAGLGGPNHSVRDCAAAMRYEANKLWPKRGKGA